MTRDIPQTFWRSPLLPWVELRSTWQSRQAYKTHSHAQLSIGAIVEGQTRCVCNGETYLLSPGDLIVIPAHAPHSCNPVDGQPRSYHMLYIETDFQPAPQILRSESLFRHYLQAIEDLSPHVVETLLAALPAGSVQPVTLRPTSQQLQETFLENLVAPPSLDALAHRFSLRKETLIRTFKQDTGLTPVTFLNNARIEFAKACLRDGADIADVGYQSGFADQSHFHKTFVSYTAATPVRHGAINI